MWYFTAIVSNILFNELGRHDKMGGSHECANCEACKKSVQHVLFECASYDFQQLDFLDFLRTVLPPNAFKAFLCGNIFDKTALDK